ncbi:MAG TPA: alpha/beta fold hydrolase, partial [Nakamurella sp.]
MTAANWDARTWDMVQSGPADAERTVLLLPGGWCTAVFYQELMAEPALAGIRLVAVTLPGNGGTRAPQDLGVENYARLTAELAAGLGCTAVVGHSMGANVALEMAGSGAFTGPVVLLAPSFSRRDEAMVIRILDRLAPVLGRVALPGDAVHDAVRGDGQPAAARATRRVGRGVAEERPGIHA